MFLPPAYADAPDTSDSGLVIVVIAVGIVAAVAILAFVPLALAWKRRLRHSDVVAAGVILWGLVTAGSLICAVNARMQWSHEQTVRIQSGYYDPQTAGDAPTLPWAMWGGLVIAYGALVAWPLSQGRAAPAPAAPDSPQL